MSIQYRAKWKELLVGLIGNHSFSVEMTMGTLHVYFPTEEKWNESAPQWAIGQYGIAREEVINWCSKEEIPVTFESHAWVDFTDQIA